MIIIIIKRKSNEAILYNTKASPILHKLETHKDSSFTNDFIFYFPHFICLFVNASEIGRKDQETTDAQLSRFFKNFLINVS